MKRKVETKKAFQVGARDRWTRDRPLKRLITIKEKPKKTSLLIETYWVSIKKVENIEKRTSYTYRFHKVVCEFCDPVRVKSGFLPRREPGNGQRPTTIHNCYYTTKHMFDVYKFNTKVSFLVFAFQSFHWRLIALVFLCRSTNDLLERSFFASLLRPTIEGQKHNLWHTLYLNQHCMVFSCFPRRSWKRIPIKICFSFVGNFVPRKVEFG